MRSEQERALRRALADLGLTSITFDYHHGHVKMTVTYQGRTKTFTVAGSPRDLQNSTTAARQDVRRWIRGHRE